MKKQMPVGLVVEGSATSSPVLRLSGLIEELGPIKSAGLQVARRISNFLRAGYAITEYGELECAQLVLLRLPDSEVPRVVQELCRSPLPFNQMSFVVCETWLSSDTLTPLRRQGSQIASLVGVSQLAPDYFVIEGDPAAVRKTKRLLGRGEARMIEIRPGTKSLYFAANLLFTALPIPLLQFAHQALRESGIAGNDLALLSDEWLQQLYGRLRKGGRAVWGGPLNELSEETADEYFSRVAALNPELSAVLQDWLALARREMRNRPKSRAATTSKG